MKRYLIGVDIGGTNTDAVLIDEKYTIVAREKSITQVKPEQGVEKSLEKLFKGFDKSQMAFEGLFIGTTHATNAILECRNLNRVGVIRLAGHRPKSLGCCAFWPAALQEAVYVGCESIGGGFYCDGRPISEFSRVEAKAAGRRLVDQGAEAIAIVGTFSPSYAGQELECAEALFDELGRSFPLTLSHTIGGIGFIERENGTILNCALKKTMTSCLEHLEKIKERCGVNCPLWITQNDGSILGLKQAIEFPLLTISSGPTNSFVGASRLSGVKDAIVVDIGGTSTDIGMIVNGYPKRSMHNVNIGGVGLNFRIPDVIALAIGGGSYVEVENESVAIGPQSCSKELMMKSRVFGGAHLTLTDVAYAAGLIHVPGGSEVLIDKSDVDKVVDTAVEKIEYGIKKMLGNKKGLPLIVVGGAAPLMRHSPQALLPDNYEVANAYGSAMAEVAGTVDSVVSLEKREEVLEQLKTEAKRKAIANGSDPALTNIVEMTIVPYHYMSKDLARVIIKASGRRKK